MAKVHLLPAKVLGIMGWPQSVMVVRLNGQLGGVILDCWVVGSLPCCVKDSKNILTAALLDRQC